MTYAFLSAADAGNSASGTTLGVAATYVAGEHVYVHTNRQAAGTTETITDGTNSYTKIGANATGPSGDTFAVYECLSTAAGSFTITQTLGTASAFRGVQVLRYSGLTGSSAQVSQGQTTAGTGTDAVSSGNITPSSQPGILIGWVYDVDTATDVLTAGTGFTKRAAFTTEGTANGTSSGGEDNRLTSTSAVPATWTTNNGTNRYLTFAIWCAEQPPPPVFTQQPLNQSVANGATATFTVAVTNTGTGLAYQWQDNRTGSFTNVSGGSGATTASYTTAAVGQAFQGRQYQVVVTDSNGSATSAPASLGVIGFAVLLWDTSVQVGSDVWLRDPTTAVAAGATTINAVPGAWSWAGTHFDLPTQIPAIPGAWSWAGTVATTNQVINAIAGAWSWAGTTATFSQLVNQVSGAWSWTGTTATLTQLVSATPGTWSWSGTSATMTQLLNAAPGTWSWNGTTATFGGGVTNLDAIPGTWSWAGTTASLSQLINAIPGTWSLAGTTATLNQVINASPGTYTWAGTTASTNQAINATPGTWSWSGTVAGIVQTASIDAVPSAFTWSGTTAVVTLPSDPLQDQIDELTRQLAIAKKLARGGVRYREREHRHDPTKNNQIIMALVGAVVHGFKGPKE